VYTLAYATVVRANFAIFINVKYADLDEETICSAHLAAMRPCDFDAVPWPLEYRVEMLQEYRHTVIDDDSLNAQIILNNMNKDTLKKHFPVNTVGTLPKTLSLPLCPSVSKFEKITFCYKMKYTLYAPTFEESHLKENNKIITN
jgi:hypothetical protein